MHESLSRYVGMFVRMYVCMYVYICDAYVCV